MRLTLAEVAEATRGVLADDRPPTQIVITGVSTDTRTLRPGDLFVALRGPKQDGHDYIEEAFGKGAAAALVSRAPGPAVPSHAGPATPSHVGPATPSHVGPAARDQGGARGPIVRVADTLRALGDLAQHHRRALPVTVVGVTGSVGKTTTAAMCAAVLAGRYRVARTKDDWNAEIGVPLTLLGLGPADEVAVIEMAMRGLGQIADLVRIAAPDVGVVTNIGESHLELLGTIEQIAQAKGELVEGLPPHGTAVLNADDVRVLALRGRAKARIVTFGLSPSAAVRAEAIVFSSEGMRFRLVRGDGAGEILLHTWGIHNVRNALAAAAVAEVMGIGLGPVTAALGQWIPPKMRLQPVRSGDLLIINDAYNASPASMAAAFEVVDRVAGTRRRILVLGEMKELGASSTALHREVGTQAAKIATVLIAVGGTDALALAQGAGTVMDRTRVHHAPDTAAAEALLRDLVQAADVVLVKGSRAMEMERIVSALEASRSAAEERRA